MNRHRCPLTVGTAGHIDHGKTALVAALTGCDTDRLAEEKRRGISIELGFAELDLGDRHVSLVDVPGHQRFVRTMIAGASGIDAFLLVVAADEGVMPQTVEHVAVLRALGVEAGVVALNRCDLAGPSQRKEANHEAEELMPGASPVSVSARTGAGLSELRAALSKLTGNFDRRIGPDGGAPVLHVDRVFTIDGHGTVVTGTLWSGRFERGQMVTLLPNETTARIRSIQVHDRSVEVVDPRQRVALNLAGIGRAEVYRGDVVTVPEGVVKTTYRLDVELREGAERITAQRRAQVHLGTREAPGRVADLGGGTAQLRLERPLLARNGDRVVVRGIAPPDTLGGGVVVHASPPRHGLGWEPPRRPGKTSEPNPAPQRKPSSPGPVARRLLAELRDDGPRPRPPAALAEAVESCPREVERALAELVATGDGVRVQREVIYPATEYRRLREAILDQARHDGSTHITEVRDSLGISRKYAQALLEHLNAERALDRVGDRHYPRRA